ncbi:YihY/virulence factor BrkB family protein [Mesorhizobium sp. M2D.F.Ca.ET.185.01.1.1]|uniref:YihY/virulence factor BrkB family protein n=4 Tax=Mesorhizobium TaxID=68287 RepID=UPI000FCA5E62|nr:MULTISPECIES: YihY/virulence factor BrkB family protein [unclassified Mesorhizobium]TGP83224.1 YihY/virulence factor BrkB family protein [bacterium M00.F.Ca.ET.227.01.1.1]TGP99179.1 YihY/virulence factor BrkB family protein [bacterium M00.F.Ca.ET.221.01.1.1]TGP99909.1 YihY/virulence factor BrkB family protein [bacterium M00.F.Ca.ET.222.01.1.1]TGT78321.1 YihY/virulence factor BrkB family protein [bacterium M00.F.Ca.ET.159.01.1.1]TGT88988.1 YihY/virulence factor BrkB family protein [bacterium
MLRNIVAVKRVLYDAIGHFNTDDGWAMASHLAITSLMALFPFLIFATTLASFLGARAFADTAVHLVFDTWPEQIAKPIAHEVQNVLTVRRTDLLTYGVLLAAYFASNGIEALRTSLNRAYRMTETRGIIHRRVQSIIFVLIATACFLAVSVLLVFAPLLGRLAEAHLEWIKPYMGTITIWRYIIASTVIVIGLFSVHIWLPAGKRRFVSIIPGIVFTLVAWLVGSTIFAIYLDHFSSYVTTYAGLASIMIAVVFLYIISAIFILGGELNAAISRYLEARARVG